MARFDHKYAYKFCVKYLFGQLKITNMATVRSSEITSLTALRLWIPTGIIYVNKQIVRLDN